MARILGLACFVMSVAYAVPGFCADIIVDGRSSRNGIEIPLSADMAGKTISVLVGAPNKESQTLELQVDGPEGTVVSALAFTVNGSEKLVNLYHAGQGIPLTLYSSATYRSAASMSVGARSYDSSPAVGDGGGDPNCGCLPYELVALQTRYVPNFCSRFPPMPSCSNSGGGSNPGGEGGNPGASSSGVGAKTFVSFNKCLTKAKPGAAIQLNLSQVAPANLTGNMKVVTLFRGWDGNKRASIKPKSDGKFAPRPLLLAGPVYGGGEAGTVKLLTHSSKKVKKRKAVRIEDSIGYRGQSYWRMVVGGLLRGGKGTFEMSSGAEGYAICAKLSASRQRFNGYTN